MTPSPSAARPCCCRSSPTKPTRAPQLRDPGRRPAGSTASSSPTCASTTPGPALLERSGCRRSRSRRCPNVRRWPWSPSTTARASGRPSSTWSASATGGSPTSRARRVRALPAPASDAWAGALADAGLGRPLRLDPTSPPSGGAQATGRAARPRRAADRDRLRQRRDGDRRHRARGGSRPARPRRPVGHRLRRHRVAAHLTRR